LVCVLRIPLIKYAEKMVKICEMGLLILNFEIIPKNAFSGFCQKIPQAVHEVEKIFWPISNPWTLRVSGIGCYTSKCEKNSKSLHPSAHPLAILNPWFSPTNPVR